MLNIAFWEATCIPDSPPIPDFAKILFALSFMKGGTAEPWSQEWMRQAADTGINGT